MFTACLGAIDNLHTFHHLLMRAIVQYAGDLRVTAPELAVGTLVMLVCDYLHTHDSELTVHEVKKSVKLWCYPFFHFVGAFLPPHNSIDVLPPPHKFCTVTSSPIIAEGTNLALAFM